MIVLDDPVSSSDPEHRVTFAGSTVEQLLESGSQLLVTTFDPLLARDLRSIHQHVNPDEYEIILEDGGRGSKIFRTGDAFHELMLASESQMRSPHKESRRSAGHSLRIATERLIKLIIVAGRRGSGADANLGDFDKKNLATLRPLVEPYILKPSEGGVWQMLARVLNDATHDVAEPPNNAELKDCHAKLKDLKRKHEAERPKLMKP